MVWFGGVDLRSPGAGGLQLWRLIFICYLDCLVDFVTPAREFVTFVVLLGVRGGR